LQKKLDDLSGQLSFWNMSLNVLVTLIALMSAGLVGVVTWFVVQQRRLRRRAKRIGLTGLPMEEQLRLAKQLAFYDQLTQVLAERRIHRPPHLTPREFAESLVFLPGEAYRVVLRLTNLLYRVRFGNSTLRADLQARLERVVERL